MPDRFGVAIYGLLAQVPNPGGGTAPPGSAKFTTIISWAAYVAVGVCVVGILVVGAKMALQHRQGQGGDHAASLGWVMAGCIVVGSASAIVGALV